MKVLISIALILTGCGAVAWAYLGAFAKIGEGLGEAETPVAAFFMMLAVIEAIASGDIPRLTGVLYFGLLLIAGAIVFLFFGRSRNHDDGHSV